MYYKKYLKVMNIGLQNMFEYRFNFLSNLIFSFIPFATNLLIWFAVFNTTENKLGYNIKEITTYFFVLLIVDNLVVNNSQWEIANDIKTGMLTKYLIKPLNYMAYIFYKDLPNRLIHIVVGVLPITFIGLLLKKYLVIYLSFNILIFFIISLVIGYIINFLLNFLISELSFYFSEVSNFFPPINVLKDIISGKVFPLNIVPKSIYQLLLFTPFQFIGYFPVMIILNKYSEREIIQTLFLGIGWVFILYVLCKVLWRKGLNKYSAFGG